jgi:glycosyltransferase involved in cell wall biosynthesis
LPIADQHAIVTPRMASSLYRKLVPFGSRRDRFAWISLVTLGKMREGPGPWLRAVKKGLYQLLPLSMQHRILKWTGQEAFFQTRSVRPAAADAGVEQPGLVSVVLPVCNQASMAAGAIDSVLAQTYESFELIVVDDGSDDGLLAAVRPYLDDPRVRVVTQANQGLPKALSTGFDFATGEFFTWTSADNLMEPEQLTRLVQFLRDKPAVAMVYADYELIDETGGPLQGGEFRVMDRTDKNNLAIVRVNRSTHDLNRYEDNFIGACFMYRGQVGRLLGDYNPELGLEDYDYWLRINRMFQIEHLASDEVLYRYRVHDNTLSARARELKIQERAKMLMGYERERTAWLQQPFEIQADAATLPWLNDCVTAGDTVGDFPSDSSGGKELLVLSPETLAQMPLTGLPERTSIATWFTSSEQVYRAHQQLAQLPVAAFANDEDTAARLALFTRTVFHGKPTADCLALAKQFASNSSFFRRTRDAERLQRAVPTAVTSQQPLRVLLQLDTFGKGGLERVVEDLATSLLTLGCEVGLLAIDGSTATADVPQGVECVTLPRTSESGYSQLLRDGKWHAVSAHASTFGAATADSLRVPFVQVVHNSYVWFERDQIDAYRDADRHTSCYACVSAQALGYADLRLQLDVQKMLVIENGIAPESTAPADARKTIRSELGLTDDDFVFLQVASLQPAKAHRVAVHALAELRKQHPNAKLVCLGNEMSPVHAATVRSDVVRLGLTDAVVFAGHRSDADACYAMADAFFLPSYWEGCSLAVWEAIRQGLPLVLSNVGAAQEQLRHGSGVIIEPPFESMFALDASNLDAVTRDVDAIFVAACAVAMSEAITTATTSAGLPHIAHRNTMAERHLLLMSWLVQRGTVAGIRQSVARASSAG